jgi:hypothetical protein
MPPFGDMPLTLVASWPLEQRLGETLKRAAPKLGPEAGKQLLALVEPAALEIMAGMLSRGWCPMPSALARS